MAELELIADLKRERERFFGAVAAISPQSMTTPGLVGEWSARELIAHLGYWVGHAAEQIHRVEEGRGSEAEDEEPSVDEVNETVARIARQTDLARVRAREAASVEALIERLAAMDPALLAEQLADGSTLEEAIREDASVHYAEHADELVAMTAAPPHD